MTPLETMARALAFLDFSAAEFPGRDGIDNHFEANRAHYLQNVRVVLHHLAASVDHSTPVTAQIVRAYVDGVLGEK